MSDWADIEAELSGLTERGEQRGRCDCKFCSNPRIKRPADQRGLCRYQRNNALRSNAEPVE